MSFAFGSMFFTHYAKRFSSIWMNTYKALVALVLFFFTVLFTSGFHDITFLNFLIFFSSGFIALGIGDIFLVKSFSLIGPGRTMLLFGFQPLLVGILSYIFFSQKVTESKFFAIVFFILCLITFSYESFQKTKRWEIRGLLCACLGMFIDGSGIIITRYAFDMNKELTGFEGNFYRCLGAIFAYTLIRKFKPFDFRSNLNSLTLSSKLYVTIGAFFGTYLSLAFYLEAIKTAHLASITAIAITSVIFASFFEAILEKKWPSKFLFIAFIFFLMGMYFILGG